MKQISSFAVLTLALVLVACGEPSMEKRLLGAWEIDSGEARGTFSYTADHRYTQTVYVGRKALSGMGTWKIENGALVTTAEKSTIEPEAGKIDRSDIVTLTDAVLVLKDHDGHLITYKRVGTK